MATKKAPQKKTSAKTKAKKTAAPPQKQIELALQGGGAHGAITWGVLDRLLEDERVNIAAISGTSAGAMNAVLVADGLAGKGGREAARKKLHDFWKAVSDAARFSPLQRTFWDRWVGNWNLDNSPAYLMMDYMARSFSPYEINPLDINPLRQVVETMVDFKRVNNCKSVQIFVTATNVRTGTAHIFRQPEITAESLMASAALPFLYKAVEIKGEAYWDGGFTGNPALFPLVDDCHARDIVLVQVNPFYREDVPHTPREIINRLNEITFNAGLLKELRAIMLLKDMIENENLEQESYRDMRIHRIHADKDVARLSASSKLNAEWDYLVHLRDMGRKHAEKWLKENWDNVGEKSTFDLSCALAGSIRPVSRPFSDAAKSGAVKDKPKKPLK